MKNSNRIQKKWAVASFMIGTLSLGLSAHADDANMKSEEFYIGSTKVNVVYQKKSDTKIEVAAPIVTEGRVCETCDDKLYTLNVQANDFNDIKKLDGMLMQQIYSSGGSSQVPHPPQQDVAAAPQAPAAPSQDDIDARDRAELLKSMHSCVGESTTAKRVDCMSKNYTDILTKRRKNHLISPKAAMDALTTDLDDSSHSFISALTEVFTYNPKFNRTDTDYQAQGERERTYQGILHDTVIALDRIMSNMPANLKPVRDALVSYEEKILKVRADQMKELLKEAKQEKGINTDAALNSYIRQRGAEYTDLIKYFDRVTNPSAVNSYPTIGGFSGDNIAAINGMYNAVNTEKISASDADDIFRDYSKVVSPLITGLNNSYRVGQNGQINIDPNQISTDGSPVPTQAQASNSNPVQATGQVQKIPGFNGVKGGVKPTLH